MGRASILQVRTPSQSWIRLLEIAVTMVWYLMEVSPGLEYHLFCSLLSDNLDVLVLMMLQTMRPVALKPYDASIGIKPTELSLRLGPSWYIVWKRYACIPVVDFFFHGSETPGVASAVSAIQKGVIHKIKSPAMACHC